MRYGCQVWGQHKTTITKRVLLLQKAAVRIITFSPPMSKSNSLFYNLKLLNIFDLIKTLNVLFVHQALNSKLPTHVQSTFNFSKLSHCYHTRGRSIGILNKASVNTSSFGIYSLSYQSVSCWNFLQHQFDNLDLASIDYLTLKHLTSDFYLQQYLSTD